MFPALGLNAKSLPARFHTILLGDGSGLTCRTHSPRGKVVMRIKDTYYYLADKVIPLMVFSGGFRPLTKETNKMKINGFNSAIVRRAGNAVAALALVGLLAGCMEQELVINVQPDGSGTVAVTQLPRMVTDRGKSKLFPLSMEVANGWATPFMGSATLVSATTFPDGNGTGVKGTLAFADINKLQVPTGPLLGMPGSVITFKMEKIADGDRITAIIPKTKPQEDKPNTKTIKSDPKQDENMMQQIRDIAGTFKQSIVIVTPRPIKKTNCKFKKGNAVTLLQLNWGAMLKQKNLIDKETKSVAYDKQADKLNKLPGCKVNKKDVTIDF